MITFFRFYLALSAVTACASLPPEKKYIDFQLKNHELNGQDYSQYPLKLKYAIACPLIDAKMKDHAVHFAEFDRNLFAMMVPCLKFNYKMTKQGVSKRDQDEYKANFNIWLQTCADQNLIDIIDVTNSLDLIEPCKLAAAALDKKIRTKTKKNVYYPEDIHYLRFRPLSFAQQFLSNLKKHKNRVAVPAPEVRADTTSVPHDFKNPSVSWLAWLKSLVFKKQSKAELSESKDLVRYKVSPFAQLKFNKKPDSLFQKIKSWFAFVFWN